MSVRLVSRFLPARRLILPYSYHATNSRRQYSNDLKGRTVRIGCASGFWGDTAASVPQLVYSGKINYLVFDYLSEITMSLLAAVKKKKPEYGFCPDFIQVAMKPFLRDIKNKGIRVISNAGGCNPHSCAEHLRRAADDAGVKLKISVITGDSIMGRLDSLEGSGIVDMNSQAPLPKNVETMNAYIGAGPIARALDCGADVVITGRCVDSAVVLGPLMHTFGWTHDQYDLLAAGSLAGHLVECGAQSTGGIFTDWHRIDGWENIGFPIVECAADGNFIMTKPPKTGGLVSPATVAEQLVYEIGDPERYILPDVICDFSKVTLKSIQDTDNAVLVEGVKGSPPTENYKVCATYSDGYRMTAVAPIVGPRSIEKGRKTAQAILDRVRNMFKVLKMDDFSQVTVQMLGSEDLYGPNSHTRDTRDSAIWLAAHHKQRQALEVLAREIAPAGTGMAPGLTNIVGGRPKVSPIMKLFSFLHPKEDVTVDIFLDNEHREIYKQPLDEVTSDSSNSSSSSSSSDDDTESEDDTELTTGTHTYRLEDLAYTRSGDKGNNGNIGVIARHPTYLPYIKKALTPESVYVYFEHLFDHPNASVKNVKRYNLPGVNGLNFVLKDSLGGGGIASLRTDPQGKGIGQMLLDFQIEGVPDLKAAAEKDCVDNRTSFLQ